MTARPGWPLVSSRPLIVVCVKSELSPRITSWAGRPRLSVAVTPGMRSSDSATDRSGSWPMSSARIASTKLSAFRLRSTALRMAARVPTTTISSMSVVRSCAARGSPASLCA